MKTAAADATADPLIDPGTPGTVWVGCRPVTVFDIAQTTDAPQAVPTSAPKGLMRWPVPVQHAPRATLDNANDVWDTGRNANGIQ